MPDRLSRAKRSLRKKGNVRRAGEASKDPDARDQAREQTRRGDPLWFPWLKRRR